MMLTLTMTLSALAWCGVQDNARQDEVRAQIQQEVHGEAPEAGAHSPSSSDYIMLQMLRQLDGSSRNPAFLKLRQLGSAVRPILPRFLEKLSPFALQSALEFLLEEAPDAAAVATIERMLGGDDLVARVIVARSLGKVRGPAQSPLIDRALGSADRRVREEALRALSEDTQADPRLVAEVAKFAQSENSEERRFAAELCGSKALREHAPSDEIVAALMHDSDAKVRRIAIEAWLFRANETDESAALNQFSKLVDAESRDQVLRGVLRRKWQWVRLFDRGMDELGRWDDVPAIADLLELVGQELADATLVKVFAQADRERANKIASWLKERKSIAGVDIALARLADDSSSECFEYLGAVAPDRLVPLGSKVLEHASYTWRFYAEHADEATVSKALELLLPNAGPSDLLRIVRDRSSSKNFEEFVRALPYENARYQWVSAVRTALARITGPEHIPLALEKSAEIDSESFGIIMKALNSYWTPEHAPAVIAAAENYLLLRKELRSDVAEVLAQRVGPAGRAALHKIVLGSNNQASQIAFVALLRTASPTEERTLVTEALQPEGNESIAAIALRHSITRAADPELRALVSKSFGSGIALESLEAWARTLPSEVRDAEVMTIAGALQSSNDEYERAMAVQTLGSLRGAEAVKRIATFLGDATVRVRQAAVLALQRTGEPDAMPHLIEALRDPDEKVRTSAKSAIEVLRLYFEEKERWEKR